MDIFLFAFTAITTTNDCDPVSFFALHFGNNDYQAPCVISRTCLLFAVPITRWTCRWQSLNYTEWTAECQTVLFQGFGGSKVKNLELASPNADIADEPSESLERSYNCLAKRNHLS